MGALDQTRSNQLIDATLGTTTLVASTTLIHCRLLTAVGSATANGTELATSGGYTSGTGAPTISSWNAANTGAATNIGPVTVTNMPVATITSIELWDSNATPKRQWWGNLTASKTTNSGDTFSIAGGALSVALT